MGPREKKVEAKPVTPVAPTPPVQVKTTAVQPVRRPPTAARQVSEDDEIARIKRENKAAGSSQAPAVTEAETPASRTSILKKATPSIDESTTEVSQVPMRFNLAFVLSLRVSCFLMSMTYLFVDYFYPFRSIFRRHKLECRQQQHHRNHPLAQAAKVRRRVQARLRRHRQSPLKLRRYARE